MLLFIFYFRVGNDISPLHLQQVKNYTMIAVEQVAFLEILTFIAGALLFVGMSYLIGYLLRPQRPNTEKLHTYESGETPAGSSWGKFNTRFYVMAIVFLLFEVETVLLFPWAAVWANPSLYEATGGLWAYYTAISAVLFITLLAVGLAYVWRQGHLVSAPPALPSSSFSSGVPQGLYDQVSNYYAQLPTKKQYIRTAQLQRYAVTKNGRRGSNFFQTR
jgi:NADH-quinone oxidoreductase subunit A